MSFDLTKVQEVAAREDEGQWIEIKDETGQVYRDHSDQPVRMRVVGTYSARYRRAEESLTDRVIKRSRKAADFRRDRIDLVAALVVEWNGFYKAGKPLDCTRENVAEVLDAAYWIRAQVEEAAEDHAGFSGRLSPNS